MLSMIKEARLYLLAAVLVLMLGTVIVPAQSGKSNTAARRTITLNVIARAPEGRLVTKEDFDLYDGGVSQEIETFSRIDAGTRIVLLVDDSSNLKVENDALQKAIANIINELYADDEMMIVAYNESAEILEEMTPDLDKLQVAHAKLVRKGFPNLFDALIAVSDALSSQAKTGFDKRAIILISDGYDSESKTKFDAALRTLQDENIMLYAIQVADRTRGALLRDKPKPPAALDQLTSGTGGAIFAIDKSDEAAKLIADDLRKHWYRLVYSPSGVNPINERRLMLICRDTALALRTKGSHPGRFHQ
jgi:VWFA-related protein